MAGVRPGLSPLMISGREVAVNTDGCGVDDLSFCGAVSVTVPADVAWDDFVATAVTEQWVGVEALSGQPGSVGVVVASGRVAYGQGVGEVVASVRTWDEEADRQRTFAAADCEFRAGGSRFSASDRYRILDVAFLMRQGDLTAPVRDAQLLEVLGVDEGERVPLERVRTALLGEGLSRRS